MSLRQSPGSLAPLPYRPHGVPVASYATYLQAQFAVDSLADRGFPVENLAVIGTDLRLVEQVMGRLTKGRAIGAGALSGAWFGALVGLLIALFTTSGFFGVLLSGVAIGALWGLLLAWLGYAATGGQRDFVSRSGVVAERYEVLCRGQQIDEARVALAELSAQPDSPAPLLTTPPPVPPIGEPRRDVPPPV